MNVLLVHNYFLEEDAVEQKVMRPYPPLGILSVSAYLESKGIDHDVFDGTFSSQKKLNDFIRDSRPDYIGFYVNFLVRKNVLRTIEFVKTLLPNTTIILGGPDGKYHSKNYLDNGADYIVIGEGEESFYQLIDNLQKGVSVTENDGIAFKEKDKTVINPARNHIKDLDALPFPNRKKVDLENYLHIWKQNHAYSSITVNTQRGCPFTCKWCSHAVYGDTYRRRSPKNVVQELALLMQDYNPDRFWFVDDVFTMSKKWMEEFVKELKAANLTISYECITRADKLAEETIKLLKESGCHLVWIGAESGSQKVLDLMDRRVDALQVRDMIKLAKVNGIQTGTFIMLGYPGETEEDIYETIEHLKDCNPDFFTINKAYPIKGTKLYDSVEEILTGETDWKTTPDNEIDFKRSYKSHYYDFAIRKIYNEVWKQNFKHKGEWIKSLKCGIKSMAAGIGLKLSK